jgi:hypothetical protein
LAFIAKINTANSANTLLSTGDSGGGGANDNVILGGAGTLVGIGAYNTNTPIMTSTIEDTLPHICVITNNEIVVDGVQRVTGTWNPLINYTKIGFDTYAGGARNSIARVAEIISYKQKLSSSSCIELSNRINSKYAIY